MIKGTHFLNIDYQTVNERKAREFCDYPDLTDLSLYDSMLTNEGAAVLAENPDLQTLRLNATVLGDCTVKNLCSSTSITDLHIAGILSGEEAALIASNTTLRTLMLNMMYETDSTKHIQAVAQSTSIETLGFAHNVTTEEGARALAANTSITTLNITSNLIHDNGATALFANTTIRTLWISDNGITEIGAQALAHNTTLEKLDISKNPIHTEGAAALAKNTSITVLFAHNTAISHQGAKALAKNTTLTNLTITINDIRGAGLSNLAKSRSITSLWVPDLLSGKVPVAFSRNTVLLDLRVPIPLPAGVKERLNKNKEHARRVAPMFQLLFAIRAKRIEARRLRNQ